MSRTITVITPENITITYRLAGVASRFIALVIDLVIQALLILIIALVIGRLSALPVFGGLFSAAGFIALFLVIFVYKVFFEMMWGGKTPGKRILGLRVIREGGYPINLTSSAVRK